MPEITEVTSDPKLQLLLSVGDDPSMSSLLTKFKELYDKNPSPELKQAKTDILCNMVVSMIQEKRGWFQIYAPWGKNNCRSCSGAGVIFKFEKSPAIEPCRCDNGYIWVDCGKCDKSETGKSTGIHTKINSEKIPCRYCSPPAEELHDNPEMWKQHIGQQRKRCRSCLGQKVVKNIPRILPRIQSTTICKTCDGLGWFTPAQRPKRAYCNPLRDALNNLGK
jgi:hypothetical protein